MAAATAAPRSPATSPRLPSPPPFPEVQLPPKSPGMPASDPSSTSQPSTQSLRRIRPGTKAADMMSGPPLVPLNELDSAFQLQEHLKSLHAHHTHPPSSPQAICPINPQIARLIATPPPSVDRSLWLYELTRFLVARADDLITSFFRETPPCSASTCPEMRASEWQYLCAVHEPPKPCCAIDYSCHTLDWAAYVLTSQKHFPSRLTLGEGVGGVKALTNIMRRVYRIFAHAWFSHRGTFWEVEGREGLYVLFKTVCDVYGLIPEENYTIPKEAEGLAEEKEEGRGMGSPEKKGRIDEDDGVADGTATALRRHTRATPSVGSAVTMIPEGDEENGKETAGGGLGGLVEKMSKSVGGEAPLAAISKSAERVEVPPAKREAQAEAAETVENGTSGHAESVFNKDKLETEETGASTNAALRRSKSSDSVATIVKVEGKEGQDD